MKESYSPTSKSKLYVHRQYELKSENGESYILKLNSLDEPSPTLETGYDGFSIFYQGKSILTYYTGEPLKNNEGITVEANKETYLQVPLDDKSFALCFSGWPYGMDNAPELVIVVVYDGKAKVVFDDYAFAYKYTPAPNFGIEYVRDVTGIGENPDIYKKSSFLKSRTKHKIWREGNVLKYKSWK